MKSRSRCEAPSAVLILVVQALQCLPMLHYRTQAQLRGQECSQCSTLVTSVDWEQLTSSLLRLYMPYMSGTASNAAVVIQTNDTSGTCGFQASRADAGPPGVALRVSRHLQLGVGKPEEGQGKP